jgi:transposase
MPSLVAKTVHGNRYWQIVTSRRVHGQPRQIVLAHLGTTQALLARLAHTDQPLKARTFDFGLLAAAWRLAHQLDLVATVDRHVAHRGRGPSVGQYLLLAALNRLAHPTSKAQLAHWYEHTALRRWLPLAPRQLTSQRFWDAMDALDDTAIAAIETDLTRTLVDRFQVALRCLCFDCTNFDTFIDTATSASLAQRGHAKSKRTDLRVVGLALMVSTDFHLPLFSEVYPGNQPDSVTFQSVTEKLRARYRVLAGELAHVTLVFDKGNNSAENLTELAGGPYRVIGSLVPSQHPKLLAIPLRRFETFSDPRLEGVSAYRTTYEAFSKSWTVVITRSTDLLRGQLRGIAQHLNKRRRALEALQGKLRRSQQPGAKGKGYTRATLEAHAKKLRAGQYLKEILHIEVSGRPRNLQLNYRTDRAALTRLERTILGKRILFTDNHQWSTEEIILGYRSQYHVEAAFRQMKNPHFVSWEPMYHWTDQKIRVHALYCVMALILAALLHRQARRAGIPQSFETIAAELTNLREVMNFHAPAQRERGGRLRTSITYTEATPLQAHLVKLLDLDALKATARAAAKTS